MTEVLIACSLFTLVAAASYGFLDFGQKSWEMSSRQADATLGARLAIDTMTRDLREAKNPADGGVTIPLAQADQITFYANIDADPYAERIRYYVSNGELNRGVAEYHAVRGYVGPEAAERIAGDVQVLSFLYFDDRSNQLVAQSLTEEQRARVRMITVSVEIDAHSNRPPRPVRMESVARLRNLSFSD
ncbi:MAG: PilW family protein [Terriglobia bacterium]